MLSRAADFPGISLAVPVYSWRFPVVLFFNVFWPAQPAGETKITGAGRLSGFCLTAWHAQSPKLVCASDLLSHPRSVWVASPPQTSQNTLYRGVPFCKITWGWGGKATSQGDAQLIPLAVL